MLERTIVEPSLRVARRVVKSSRVDDVRSSESWTFAWPLVIPCSDRRGEKFCERVFDVGCPRSMPSLVSVRVKRERAPICGKTFPSRSTFSIAPQSKSRSGNVKFDEFDTCELKSRFVFV